MKHGYLPRRGFLTSILAAGAALGFSGAVTAQSTQSRRGSSAPDESWLTNLTGAHRQVFDASSVQNGKVLSQVRNFLDAYGEAYGLADSEVSAAVVVHGSAFPLVFDDATWARFRLGERFGFQDPGTKEAAARNVFVQVRAGDPVPSEASLDALQRRGVVFVLCNNTLKRVTGDLARAAGRTPESVREELLAGLLPGVTVVPAAVVALNRAQEHGLTYVYSG
ncbi:MAG: hypothetical protein ACLGHS_13860 [Actinomycetes bacterium]